MTLILYGISNCDTVKKARVCHTNDEWKKLWVQGNQDSRDTLDHFTSKASSCSPMGPC